MRWTWWMIGALGVTAVGVYGYQRQHHAKTAADAQTAAGDSRPVPVLVANSEIRDVPRYLYGLGAVTAYNTVTVKTQIAGKIDTVIFKEGQVVHKGDLLVQIDPRPYQIQLAQAEAALARDSAQLRNDRLNLERDIELRKENLVAQQVLDNQQALVNQDEGTVQSDQAAIETAKLNLAYCRITSLIDGVTGIRLVDVGNYVQPTDTTGIVVLTQLEPIAVIFTLPEDNLPPIAKAMAEGPLTAEAFSRDGKDDLGPGKVLVIDNQINQTTGTIRIKAIFDNPKHALWPNQFVKVRLLVEVRHGTLVVPASAVQHGPDGAFVYIVAPNLTVTNHHVEVGSIEGDLALITSGLKPGEQVVTDGQYALHAGAHVAPRSSPNALDGGSSSSTTRSTP